MKKNISNLSEEKTTDLLLNVALANNAQIHLDLPVDTTQHLAPRELSEGHLPDSKVTYLKKWSKWPSIS
jgi:hypothetical protein